MSQNVSSLTAVLLFKLPEVDGSQDLASCSSSALSPHENLLTTAKVAQPKKIMECQVAFIDIQIQVEPHIHRRAGGRLVEARLDASVQWMTMTV